MFSGSRSDPVPHRGERVKQRTVQVIVTAIAESLHSVQTALLTRMCCHCMVTFPDAHNLSGFYIFSSPFVKNALPAH
jgi:hypothetical protein